MPSTGPQDLPYEVQFSGALVGILQSQGFRAGSPENPVQGKVDLYCTIDSATFAIECVMATASPAEHHTHRDRFDNPSLPNYSAAQHKCLLIIGGSRSDVAARVEAVPVSSPNSPLVEIVGLVPSLGYTRYTVLSKTADNCPLKEFIIARDGIPRNFNEQGLAVAQEFESMALSYTALHGRREVWVKVLGADLSDASSAFAVTPTSGHIESLKDAIKAKKSIEFAHCDADRLKIMVRDPQTLQWSEITDPLTPLLYQSGSSPYGVVRDLTAAQV
jgi:hypothetical protein